MLSFNRFLYIVLIIAVLGGIFLGYSTNESRPASVHVQDSLVSERNFTEIRQVDEGERPRVWLLGDSEDGRCGEIYGNVRQLCEDLGLTAAGEGRLDMDKVEERDLVIFCGDSVSPYADITELEQFVAGGGRAILAAGLGEGEEDNRLWQVLGIQEKSGREDCHDLVFEQPLLPVQPDRAYYDGSSGSARLEVSAGASVYIRDGGGVPILYTYPWEKGSVCLINGMFLADIRCMGLLTGAVSALLPDFVYPVLGVKAVFLDNFPMFTAADDELCRRIYGYSAEGFIRDVMWPAFQGVSLRMDTPFTSSILAASSEESLETAGDELFTVACKPALQFGGELAYAARCPEDGKIVFHQDMVERFRETFINYTVRSLVMETDNFSPKLLDVPGGSVRAVRGMLESRDTRLSWKEGYTVFPAATRGNSIDGGNLFSICSVLGAYGMVSHVFDINRFITRDGNTAAWDLDRMQLGLFESEVLARAPWLEGRTLIQTENDVRSYQNLDYGWVKSGRQVELNCSGIVKGQAFFYHTNGRIVDGEGLTYQEVGNGYYLLRVQENHGVITLEEGK